MERLSNGFTLDIPAGCFPLSTDSMLLCGFARIGRHARVLDLGAGCGTLGLMLCAADPTCRVVGIELDPLAHDAALENIRRNALLPRMSSICADLRCLPCDLADGSFDCCISNPPYFSGGAAVAAYPLARRRDLCPPEALFHSAAQALKFGGDFFLVNKPENLAHLIACGAAEHLQAKRLLLVRHKPHSAISLTLLSFRKGGKPGLQIEEATLFDDLGRPTDYYQTIYHELI